jgi:hypothetical protein
MIRSDKKLKELKLIMAKDNAARIAEAIRFLRSEQPFEGAIEQLVSYYNRSNNTTLRKLISEFMNDIKDLSARNEIISEIKKENMPETTRMLVSSCWQSGLDYSEYALDFAGIFIETDDYMTALECFSVLELSAYNMTGIKKQILLEKINTGSLSGPVEKSALLRELIAVLR